MCRDVDRTRNRWTVRFDPIHADDHVSSRLDGPLHQHTQGLVHERRTTHPLWRQSDTEQLDRCMTSLRSSDVDQSFEHCLWRRTIIVFECLYYKISINYIDGTILYVWYVIMVLLWCDMVLLWSDRRNGLKLYNFMTPNGSNSIHGTVDYIRGIKYLGRNRLWVRFLAVSDIYPMFIEPTITWVPSGFSECIWLDTKNCVKKFNIEFGEGLINSRINNLPRIEYSIFENIQTIETRAIFYHRFLKFHWKTIR